MIPQAADYCTSNLILTIFEIITLLNGVNYAQFLIIVFHIYFFLKLKSMSIEFFSKLSQNYIELLEDDEYYDITIEVGEDPNVKIFHAHMNILCYRSPYLRRALASNKKNDNVLSHIKYITGIFQIILSY